VARNVESVVVVVSTVFVSVVEKESIYFAGNGSEARIPSCKVFPCVVECVLWSRCGVYNRSADKFTNDLLTHRKTFLFYDNSLIHRTFM